MSEASQDHVEERTPPAGVITDFPDLYPRQQTRFQWVVLHLKDTGEWTAYRVDLQELTCECADETFRRQEGEVCKHLAATLYQAPATLEGSDLSEWTVTTLLADVRRLLAEGQVETGSEGQAEPDADTDDSEASATGSDEPAGGAVMVEDVRDWLETGFASPEHVDVRAGSHDGVDGTILEPDNQAMADGQFEAFKSLVNSLEDSNVHVGFGDDPCNTCGAQDGDFWYFIPETDSSEVWD